MDQHVDFQKSLKAYCGFIFKWKYHIIRTAVSCKLSPLHLPIASFLCKTVNLKATWFFFFFFFQLCRNLFNVSMKHSKCLSVCQSREEHKGRTISILYEIVMGCSLENPMLAKLSELAQTPFAHPVSLAAFLFSISHYSPFA